ncbi:hypothetical protein [Agrobacterium tumefaciens]|uniref:hypothetical protein n=1 Tax=Agrobacterium tumefaciens TaxID=358 RepID=UPI001571DBED|nr:hypothetical protein [Agrobacterium tumefaciens]
MRIRITEDNRDEIVAAFRAANGKAKSNTLHGSIAFDIAKRAEAELEAKGLQKNKRKGATASYVPSGPSKSYGHSMRTTAFSIERTATDWVLVSVEPVEVWPRSSGGMRLSILPFQAEMIMAKALVGLHVRRAA